MDLVEIDRYKTAIRRGDFSRPVKCLLRDGLVKPGVTFFDYGCGRGEDIELLVIDGINCSGWDPVHRPDVQRVVADVVNLGYVLNVIENPKERAETLKAAWGLCSKVMSVAAQVMVAGRGKSSIEFGDGVLTCRNTFQKFYEQGELKSYLETEIGTEAIPAGIGTFYLFKDQVKQQEFMASRFRRRAFLPRRQINEICIEESRQALGPFIDTVVLFGRIPADDEFSGSLELIEKYGSLKHAFISAKRFIGMEIFDNIARRRREDILVYLALSRFVKRPANSMLPRSLQRDMRVFFGSYSRACAEADALLFKAGDSTAIDEACKKSTVGKLLPDDLYVHKSAVESLDPILRIYEGCGQAYLGEVDGANLIKIHRRTGKISYLIYPGFDNDAHPTLQRCVKLNLRSLQIQCYDYSLSENPPVLHRKEAFLANDAPLRKKFAKLTQQEEMAGLLDVTALIGTRDGWAKRLAEHGFTIKGHCLVAIKR